jgi:type II secretory pathway pseudopilin PulG
MSCRRHRRTQRGATLIESVVALGVFGMVATAAGALLTQHIRGQRTNGTTTAAITVAEAEMESLRSLDYPDIAARTFDPTPAAGSPAYHVKTTVVADSPAPSLKSITTQVTWTEPAGVKAISLYAIYADVTR